MYECRVGLYSFGQSGKGVPTWAPYSMYDFSNHRARPSDDSRPPMVSSIVPRQYKLLRQNLLHQILHHVPIKMSTRSTILLYSVWYGRVRAPRYPPTSICRGDPTKSIKYVGVFFHANVSAANTLLTTTGRSS